MLERSAILTGVFGVNVLETEDIGIIQTKSARQSATVFIRYWGSYFKSLRQARVMAEEFRALTRKGWNCHLVLERLPQDSSWLKELEDMQVGIHCEPRPVGKYDWRAALRVRRFCRRLCGDILVCENIHLPPLAGAMAARVPVRVWIKRAMNASFEENRKAGLKERLAFSTRISCRFATSVIAVSAEVKKELRELSIPDRKIMVRPNPRRLGYTQEIRRESVRQSLGYSQSDVIITSVGRAVDVKGWDLLIRAFAKIAVGDARLKLCLIGSFEAPSEHTFYDKLQTEIVSLKIGKKILFTGHLEEIGKYLRASDLFVMPSRSEGFSNALIEALEAGLPCVATKVGIAEEAVRPGYNGFLVARDDEAGLTAALQRLACDDQLRATLARNASVPESIPTVACYAEQLANDYESLLCRRS